MFERIVDWSREESYVTRHMGVSNKGSAVAVWILNVLLIFSCIAILIFGNLGYIPSPILFTFIVTSIILIIAIAFFRFISIK